MIQGILIILFVTTTDSVPLQSAAIKKDYTNQMLVNGLISSGFGITAAILHTKGNKAFHDYQSSTTMVEALDNWNRVKTYDFYRNACIAGSLVFLARFFYYHVKHTEPATQTRLIPSIDIQYSFMPRLTIGLYKKL
jgi:hypothetical protein